MGRDAMTHEMRGSAATPPEMRGSAATPPEMRGSAATPRRTITDAGADRAVGCTVVDVTQAATPLFDLRFPGGGALPGRGGLPRDDLRARGVRHSPHARPPRGTAGSLRPDRLRDGGAARTRGSALARRAQAPAADRPWPPGCDGGHAPAPPRRAAARRHPAGAVEPGARGGAPARARDQRDARALPREGAR